MRVLVYEQFHSGHYYHFVRYLLPELLKITDDVVVSITRQGRESTEFAAILAPFLGQVTFDATLPYGHDRVIRDEKWKLHADLREAVRRNEPDYVLLPSGDQQTRVMGLFRLAGLGGLPGRCPGEVGIHMGRGAGASDLGQIRDRVDEFRLACSGWTRVHVMNLLFHERIQARAGALARMSDLLPHPVMPGRFEKTEARRRLGLEQGGRLMGIAGLIDYRKAVPEVLAAFRQACGKTSDRLLLAGPLDERHRQTIVGAYRDLVEAGRVVLLDRLLSADEIQAALSAMDFVCVPYPGFVEISGVLLEGLAAGRPVLANNLGWCEAIVKRFGVGWTCDVRDPSALARAIATAFAECGSFRQNEATSRLLAFHTPENFSLRYLRALRERAGLSPAPTRSWSWVCEALPSNSGATAWQ
jgi:glycosyltransferase involved in cell wall biosynthesis